MKPQEEIDLWTQRGIPYAEVRKRLSERTDEECELAAKFLIEQKIVQTKQIKQMAGAADEYRDTEAILRGTLGLEGVDHHLEKKIATFIPADKTEMFLELHALMVEGIVRTAKRCFPLHSKN